jgi:hypothetical protein
MTDDTLAAWEQFRAADTKLAEAVRRLREAPYAPVLRRALAGGGDFRAAVEFLLHGCPDPAEFAAANLDVLLPLAIEGGTEQRDVRELVGRVDMATVSAALPALVARVIPRGDYLEYSGLLDLLSDLHEVDLLRVVVTAARASGDPELREAAEPYEGAAGPVPALPAAPPPVPVPAPAPLPEWDAYVAARHAYGLALMAMARTDPAAVLPAALADSRQEGAALHYLAILAARREDGTVRAVLRGVPPDRTPAVLAGLADAFLADSHLWRVEAYQSLLTLLADLDEDAFRRAVDKGRSNPDRHLRVIAETTPLR